MKIFCIITSIASICIDILLICCVSNGIMGRGLACLLCLFVSGVGMLIAYIGGQMEVYERVDKWLVAEKGNY